MSRPLVDVRVEGLHTATGPAPHLASVAFHVGYGEFFALLGPPHSGKSAVLRVIGGFLAPSAGRVLVDGHDVGALPPGRRGIGYVFHQGALWPHMTARAHVAFGLERLRLARTEVERRVQVVLRRLGLADVADRRPADLTLEAQRRLALARALAVEPRVLLLDEPLAHLDPIARKTLRLELARLHRDLAVTTICATRDAADAMALSDRLAIVEEGRLAQVGTPEQVYRGPASREVARALGPASELPVRVVEIRELGVVVATARGDRVPVSGIGAFREGETGVLVLRPETLRLVEAPMGRGPGIPGRVAIRVFEGARHVYEVHVGVGPLVRVEVPAAGMAVFDVGDAVRVEVSSDTVVLLPEEGPGVARAQRL